MRKSALLLSLVVSVMPLASEYVFAQSLSGSPEIISTSINNCSIELIREESKPLSRNNHPVSYRVINGGQRPIVTMVYVGIPGATHSVTYFGDFFESGKEHVFTVGNARWKGVDHESNAAVDLVLYVDGTTCGANAAGKLSYVTGVFDGQKGAVRDLRVLIDSEPDPVNIETWLASAWSSDEPNGVDGSNDVEWRKGYSSGYRNAIYPIASSFGSRGVDGVKMSLQGLERKYGMASVAITP